MKTRQTIAWSRQKIYVESSKPIEFTEEKQKLVSLLLDFFENGPLGKMHIDEAILDNISCSEIRDFISDISKNSPNLRQRHEKFVPLSQNYNDILINPEDLVERITKNKEYGLHVYPLGPDEFMDIPQQIMKSNDSLGPDIIADLEYFLTEYPDLQIPDRIPFKETQCTVMKYRPEYSGISGVNDILRYGIWMMGGSSALVNVPKTIQTGHWNKTTETNRSWRALKAPRSLRRDILGRLESYLGTKSSELSILDAIKEYGHWLVLSERIHPGEYKLRYPVTHQFFQDLKSKSPKVTWYSKLQKMYDTEENILEISKYISTRPGELVRRFDSLLRKCTDTEQGKLLEIFLDTPGMKSKTLLSLADYYKRRSKGSKSRMIELKNGTRTALPELPQMNLETADLLSDIIASRIIKNIRENVVGSDMLGKDIYLDPKLSKIPIPKASRTSTISVPKGIEYTIPETDKVIRFYVHWEQLEGTREDLDLHAYLNGPKGSTNIGFHTGLSYEKIAEHSGDVINQPGKCAEYVDIDLDAAIRSGFEYVVMDVCNYSDRGFDTLPCWGGFLTVPDLAGNNKHWSPDNVVFGTQLTSTSSSIALMLVNLKDRSVKILDYPIDDIPVNSDFKLQDAIIDFFSVPPKITTYDVMKAHYESRGACVYTLIDDFEVADGENIITFDSVCSDPAKILSMVGE